MTVATLEPAPREHRSAPRHRIDKLRSRLNATLRGKEAVVDFVLTCLLARGHLLLEDKPGLGKTTLAKGLAAAVDGRFARVQCTPDLLPTDITGFNVFNQKTHEFEFRPGPVFSEVLLADEINRATPRTQSALLEAMAEQQVTVDAVRHVLSPEFFVVATQNPQDQHGTYPLPEAQLDRFAMKLSIGYPGRDDEVRMLAEAGCSDERVSTRCDGSPVLDLGELAALQSAVARQTVVPAVHEYLVDLGAATREHPDILLGLSPRGLLIWLRAAQACAFLRHRSFVTPDDVQHVAKPVLSVRLGIEHEHSEAVIAEILKTVPAPR